MRKRMRLLIFSCLFIGTIASFSSAQTPAEFREVEQALGASVQMQDKPRYVCTRLDTERKG